jgi:hypothetical protein
MRAALQYVATSDMPSEHKTVLLEALTHRMRERANEEERRRTAPTDSKGWQTHELEQLDRALNGRRAKGWQEADETLLRLATELQRTPAEVRTKAIERGFVDAIDFAAAKAHHEHEDR